MPNARLELAWFITPHGFGHGTRAIAMMAALRAFQPRIHFHIFTQFPQWLLDQSLKDAFTYYPLACDVGMAQRTALDIDFPETLERLDNFLPFDPELVAEQARIIRQNRCRLVVCDIAPLGIAVAEAAGVPSVLVENFTWDQIYEAYLDLAPGLAPFIDLFARYDHKVIHRIQTQPVGVYRDNALVVEPVVRKLRASREQIRQQLGIDPNCKMVIITMGGIGHQPAYLKRLQQYRHCVFVMPGQPSRPEYNVVGLDFSPQIYHPDLINASDLVIAKLGYSTFAEVWQAGVPFGYVKRERFPESATLSRYIRKHMPGIQFGEDELTGGDWIKHLDALLAMDRRQPPNTNGADQAARHLLTLMSA